MTWDTRRSKLVSGISNKTVTIEKEKVMTDISKYVKMGALGLFALIALFGSYAVVSPGERGIKITMGKMSETVLEEGVHFKLPFVTSVRTISVRVQKSEAGTESGTKDLQKVDATVALNWNVDPSTVTTMFRTVGDEEAIYERIIIPAVQESLKAAMAKMNAEEILTRRLELKATIDELLVKRLNSYNIQVRDVSLVNLSFSAAFNHAIEQKQIQEQKALQSKYVAQQAEQDAIAALNTARGQANSLLENAKAQAKAQQLLRENLTPDLVKLEYLKKWDGALPTIMSGSGAGMMFNFSEASTKRARKPAPTEQSEE